ncbi:MAG: hypothetical protein U0031_02115 [Thermomicrobiales bacterium]
MNNTNRTSQPRRRGGIVVWSALVAVSFVLAMVPLLTWDQSGAVRAQIASETPPAIDGSTTATTPAGIATPTAGTPVPVSTAAGTAATAVTPAPDHGQDGADGKDGKDGRDGADGQPGQDGQDGQDGADAVATDSDRAVDKDGKGDDGDRKKEHERERDANRGRDANGRDSNGNGGVADVVAYPPDYTQPQQIDLEQQDGSNSTAGATGQNGTVNGEPRETPVNEPATTSGPGQVNLPPAVPGLPDPATVDPALAAGIAGTTELVFDAVSDTTVFTSAPDSPQTPESAGLLAFGGPDGAVALISFDVSGVGDGSVLAARLTFLGAGSSGAPGGGVGVIYDYVAKDGLTANKAPGAENAMSVQGTPSWFERVEPGALGAVDVSGSVFGDGRITFVLTGQPEQTALIDAMESGVPPQLILTVGLPG